MDRYTKCRYYDKETDFLTWTKEYKISDIYSCSEPHQYLILNDKDFLHYYPANWFTEIYYR